MWLAMVDLSSPKTEVRPLTGIFFRLRYCTVASVMKHTCDPWLLNDLTYIFYLTVDTKQRMMSLLTNSASSILYAIINSMVTTQTSNIFFLENKITPGLNGKICEPFRQTQFVRFGTEFTFKLWWSRGYHGSRGIWWPFNDLMTWISFWV